MILLKIIRNDYDRLKIINDEIEKRERLNVKAILRSIEKHKRKNEKKGAKKC